MNKYLDTLSQENNNLVDMRELLVQEYNMEEELLIDFL